MARIDGMDDSERILQQIEEMQPDAVHADDWLLSLLKHADSEVRMRALEKLGFVLRDKKLTADMCLHLCSALTDEDELVRCASLEALGNHPYCIGTEEIVSLLGDQSGLVRGDAAKLLGMRGDRNAEGTIQQAIAIADEVEQVPMYFALCLLQNSLGLDGLLKLLKSTNYLARCAATNLLPLCVSAANREVILLALTNALADECTVAAKSSISDALAEIKRGE